MAPALTQHLDDRELLFGGCGERGVTALARDQRPPVAMWNERTHAEPRAGPDDADISTRICVSRADRKFLLRRQMRNGLRGRGEVIHDRQRGEMQALLEVLD